MCLSKIIIIIICGPLLQLVILFRDGNNFFREESISLEIIISFSLQGQVKKTKLQEAFFSTCTCWRIFAYWNNLMKMLIQSLSDLGWNEATSANAHRTGPETACHSSRMARALTVPATLKRFALSPHLISSDAKPGQLLVAELPSVLLKPTRARELRCVSPGSSPVYTNSINQRKS